MSFIEIILGNLSNAIPLIGNILAKLKVDLIAIGYNDFSNSHGDGLILIAPYPKRIYTKLQISNGTQMRLGIKDVRLRVGDEVYKWHRDNNLIFSPGDVKEVTLIFPADNQPRRGESFLLEIIDARGKSVKIKGVFPRVGP